jgi:hypothetical protein
MVDERGEPKTEVIRRQMEETRASLSEKLETLEHQVVDTVQGTTAAVADTVASVKDAVQDSMATVKKKVRRTFNLRRHVTRHPWAAVGCAVAAGYVANRLLNSSAHAARANDRSAPQPPQTPGFNGKQNGVRKDDAGRQAAAAGDQRQSSVTTAYTPLQLLAPEVEQLKALAIGVTIASLRDVCVEATPAGIAEKLSEIIDNITVKLGGQPIRGRLCPETQDSVNESPAAKCPIAEAPVDCSSQSARCAMP